MAGRVPEPVTKWFDRFPVTAETRQDCYLVRPRLPGLSVKIRGELALDVKEYNGSRGILDVSGIAQGRLQAWSKWSFPLSTPNQGLDDPAGWQRVHKQRRLSTYLLDEARLVVGQVVPADRPSCTMELSQVSVADTSWWTFALEAVGPETRLQEAIEVAAARFMRDEAPKEMALEAEDSGPYFDWLEHIYSNR
jgi:hypothetical protein